MAEFAKVAKEYRRLCDAFETCKDCLLNDLVEKTPNCETGIIRHFPEEAERIIMRWSAEHPIKTNRDKFREVFGMDIIVTEDCSKWLNEEYKEK